MKRNETKRTTIHRAKKKKTKNGRQRQTERSATRKKKTKREGLDSFFLREITTHR
jgi:hypothetical protein